MAILTILKYPDEKLRRISEPVTDFEAIKTLVQDMTETMYASKGAGLAAIQVGVPLRLFIADANLAGGGEKDPALVFINPEFIELSAEKETAEEGCLSFPDVYVPVTRSLRAKIRAFDLQGKCFEAEGANLFARCMQHETDHIRGKLLIDYVGRIKRQLILRKLNRAAAEAEIEG